MASPHDQSLFAGTDGAIIESLGHEYLFHRERNVGGFADEDGDISRADPDGRIA